MATRLNQPQPRAKKSNTGLMAAISIVVAILFLVPLIVSFYTDWLWFGDLDFRGVFSKVILTRIILFVIFAALGGAVAFAAAFFAWRGRTTEPGDSDPLSPAGQYRNQIQSGVRSLLVWIPLVVGLFSGLAGQRMWRTIMLWFNGTEFGQKDPQFNLDLSFYAFTLPGITVIVDMISMLLIVALLVGLVGHYLLGGIRIGNNVSGIKGHISRAARIQLAVTAGLWMLVKAVSYWLDRYSLLYRENDIFTGASYSIINATLPAKIALVVIAVIVAAAFFASVVYKDFRIPALATVLMLVSSLVVGNVWPALLEQFSVKPNRQAKEFEYIGRNIESTRYAYGLTDDKVTYLDNWGAENVSGAEVASDAATIGNIRLLDPDIISPTFTQNQQLRNFYGFPDTLAMDRYDVDGEMRDFIVSARELDPNALRENQRDWINRHTVYTHGNGFIAAQANTVDEAAQDAGSTRGGLPIFTVSDLQANNSAAQSDEAEQLGIKVDEPRIYYGPVIASAADGLDYAIVGDNGQGPVEYDTDNSNYSYSGDSGVGIGNWFNRAAYAVKYQELNFLLSDRVGAESRILYDRDPRERVERVAPWLTTDSTTYPAVIDGRVKWIVDGYTTLSELPYSTRTSMEDTTQDALNPDGTTQRLVNNNLGYIRNSVKATVDAYDGTVDLYEFDTEDPVLKAWMGVFPDTVKPESEISDTLRDHLRYPEDLFKVQRELLARYHVDDPGVFFNNDAFWSVPNDPTAPEGRQELNQPPYYIVAADPETKEPSFQLITPFRGLNREFLSAHMSVASDPDRYGDITVRVLPTNTQTQGPKQAQDALMSSDQVARDRTLWEGTNDLQNGNLLTLPVGGGEILYIEPVYSQRKDQESAFPKLLRVLVFYQGRVGYAPTISQALSQVGIDSDAAQEIDIANDGSSQTRDAGDQASPTEPEEDGATEAERQETGSGALPGNAEEALNEVTTAITELERAREGSFEEFGSALDKLDQAVKNYQDVS